MPEFLTPELVSLRERAMELATQMREANTSEAKTNQAKINEARTNEAKVSEAKVREASKAAGIYGLTQSESSSALGLLVVRETLASHGVSHLPGLFGASAGVLAKVEDPLRSVYLLPLLAGDKRSGLAFTEPNDAVRPTWAKVEDETLVITGRKSFVTAGAQADFLAALVDVEGEGPSMVIVDTDLPGVSMTRRFVSLDGGHHAAFAFDQVRVPRHHAIGAPGDGRARVLKTISQVRLAVAADCLGTCQWILEAVAQDLQRVRKSKDQAEKRKGDAEHLRLRFGDMRIQAYAARSMVYRTARLADAGHNVVNETIAAKVFASETANQLAIMAIQLVGGEALIEGHPLELAFRRMRGYLLAEGESDQLRVNLSRGYLDLGKGRV